MKIITVDNFHWNKGLDEYNQKLKDFDSVICTYNEDSSKDFEIVLKELIETAEIALTEDEDYFYLINVHCIFKNPKDPKPQEYFLQDQLGVLLYRYLLKVYEKSPNKLRVGFFSPISQRDLIDRNPENYIISLFPFFSSPFLWDDCCKTFNDWFDREKFPVLNTSSENLLAGYKIYSSNKGSEMNKQVSSGSKKVLFIDDQADEWVETFKEIFKSETIQLLPYKNQQEFRGNFLNRQNSDFKNELEMQLKNCDLVLSDFYLVEDHDPAKWMDKNRIANISGFQLFNDIKNIDKGMPVIMHTSSNKIPYYKVFDHFGIDDWIVKDTRVDATLSEKRDNYIIFKETIQSILENDTYQKLRIYWNEILKVENTTNDKWWYNPSHSFIESKYWNNRKTDYMTFEPLNEKKKEITVSILKSSWYALRRMLNKEMEFEEQNILINNVYKTDHFTSTSICNNLGKIIELLGIKAGIPKFSLLTNFLLMIRNTASHEEDYELFEVNDALIFLSYLLSGLNSNATTETEFKKLYPDRFINKGSTDKDDKGYPFALFWLYLQFYNDIESSKQCISGRNMILNRLAKLFNLINAAKAIEPVLKENASFITKYTLETKGIKNYEYDVKNNQFKIKVPQL